VGADRGAGVRPCRPAPALGGSRAGPGPGARPLSWPIRGKKPTES
jgi:hypothetical protein